jgi:hypothetical protein
MEPAASSPRLKPYPKQNSQECLLKLYSFITNWDLFLELLIEHFNLQTGFPKLHKATRCKEKWPHHRAQPV